MFDPTMAPWLSLAGKNISEEEIARSLDETFENISRRHRRSCDGQWDAPVPKIKPVKTKREGDGKKVRVSNQFLPVIDNSADHLTPSVKKFAPGIEYHFCSLFAIWLDWQFRFDCLM